jgi:dihydrofolate reductase
MEIALIAAMTDSGIIGVKNRMPWHLPSDMKWFRQHTLGKPIVMGRKTYESFGGRPLPQRQNIVVTRDRGYASEGITVVHDIDAALEAAGEAEEVMVIGGASFYAQMLARADRLYITYVHTVIDGDAWFPHFNPDHWRERERSEQAADDKNPFAHTFVILERAR